MDVIGHNAPGEQAIHSSNWFAVYRSSFPAVSCGSKTLAGRKPAIPGPPWLLRYGEPSDSLWGVEGGTKLRLHPETIPYGRFCWNQDCQYCRVTCQLPDDDEPREMLSCKFIVMPGMEITEMSQELKWCLRSKLPSDAAVTK